MEGAVVARTRTVAGILSVILMVLTSMFALATVIMSTTHERPVPQVPVTGHLVEDPHARPVGADAVRFVAIVAFPDGQRIEFDVSPLSQRGGKFNAWQNQRTGQINKNGWGSEPAPNRLEPVPFWLTSTCAAGSLIMLALYLGLRRRYPPLRKEAATSDYERASIAA